MQYIYSNITKSIMTTDILHHLHHFPDMEFSGIFDIAHGRIIFIKYFLFIKFNNNIYIDIKSIGDVIMSFEEFSKNKLLKKYYELSLLLIENKNIVIEKINNREQREHREYYHYDFVYTEKRKWFIDCAYFVENFVINNKEVQKDRYCCYYNINPYDLTNMEISTKSHIDRFTTTFLGYEQIYKFQKNISNYTKLAIDYNADLIEKELEEISAFQDDKINLIKLIAFNEKEGMNIDILLVIYSHLISENDTKRYAPYLENLCNNNKAIVIAQILSA